MRIWNKHPIGMSAFLVAVAALIVSFPSITNKFAYDDVMVIAENDAVHSLRSPAAYFKETYWGPARGEAALYRPVTVMLYSVQWAMGGGSPHLFHAASVVFYLAVCVLVLFFLRIFVSPLSALLGALYFVVHPVHVESVANVVGQAELLVGLSFIGALVVYGYARKQGKVTGVSAALILLLYMFGLFSKEHGIVLPGMILAMEWAGQKVCFRRNNDDWFRTRLLVLGLILIACIYMLIRVSILGEVAGDQPYWGLRYLSHSERILAMVGLFPEFIRLLSLPLDLYPDYSPSQIQIATELGATHLPGVLLLIGIGGAFVFSLFRSPVVALSIAWCAITGILISNVFFPIGVLIAERTLFLPSVGIALFLAFVVSVFLQSRGAVRTGFLAGLIAVLFLAGFFSASRQRVWEDNFTLFSTLVVEAPDNFRGHFALGEFYAAGREYEKADSFFARALSLYPEHVPSRVSFAQYLQVHGRCSEALPLFDSALDDDPTLENAAVARAICLLSEQRFEDARRNALLGAAEGWNSPTLRDVRWTAESLLVATDSIDARNRWWSTGRPYDRTGRQLRVVVRRLGPNTAQKADSLQD